MDKIGANFRSIFKTPKEWIHLRYGQEQGGRGHVSWKAIPSGGSDAVRLQRKDAAI